MGYKQCLHTHSNLCDGKDTLEEMVLSAIDKGFDSIGFSGHSFMEIYAEFSMSEEKIAIYKAEIARLQQVYGDRIVAGGTTYENARIDSAMLSITVLTEEGVSMVEQIRQGRRRAPKKIADYFAKYTRSYARMVALPQPI